MAFVFKRHLLSPCIGIAPITDRRQHCIETVFRILSSYAKALACFELVGGPRILLPLNAGSLEWSDGIGPPGIVRGRWKWGGCRPAGTTVYGHLRIIPKL